jgi:hypothetical protein
VLKLVRYAAVLGLLAGATLITVPPATAGQAGSPRAVTPMACGTMTTAAVFGGYRARMVCESRQIDGFGTTTAAAQNNAWQLQSVSAQTGVYCMTAQLPRSVDGGYRVSLACNSHAVDGNGTTLTDAGHNAYRLALIGGQSGNYCSTAGLQRPSGGFRLTLSCNSRAVENYGNTLTTAATNVTGLAQVGADTGVWCGYTTVGPVAGGSRITMSCNSRAVHGLGSDLNGAATNAYGFAILAGHYGKDCASSGSQVISGGYRATFTCTPGGVETGQGSTLSIAANNAFVAAQ